MSRIVAFDRQSLSALRTDLEAAIHEVAKKHGIGLMTGRIRYSGDMASIVLEARIANKGANTSNPFEIDFKNYANLFGLKPSDFGRTFKATGGESFTICGLRLKSRKMPILARNAKGVTYKFRPETVTAGLR